MKKHSLQNLLRNAILAALIFTFVSEPILVAAKSLQGDPQSQAIDLALQGGELYLDSISTATVESAKLIDYISVVQSTPLSQLNEAYIEDVIDRTLDMAEQTSVALGAVDDLADGIEQIGDNVPAGVDVGQTIGAGIPDEMRAELIAQGVPSEQVDQISASASSLFSARQSAASGLPADLQASLLGYGFTQSQIDEIEDAVAQHGLVNNSLNTRLAQFRATQDELANARSNMLILTVQLLGYQIAVRQSNGIQPRAATTAELETLSEDELRILIHAAHLNAMWDNDPSAEIGEGDWWFIEHFAERAADRLQTVIVETQNRGLVAELFVIRQMKMLAVSARTGDADYAKAELEALVGLLAYKINATAYYQQHASAGLPELALARVVATPSLRENVEWPVSSSAIKTARVASMEQMEFVGVQDLDAFLGNFDESNETNNQAGILFLAGIPFFENLPLDILQPSLQILSTTTSPASFAWLEAILTGNTDDPKLLAANIILSIIPVIGVIPDICSLATDPSITVKALSFIGIIGSIGDIAALFGISLGVAAASFVADVSSAVIRALFKNPELTVLAFRVILDSLPLADNFRIMREIITTALVKVGSNLDEIGTTIRAFWDDLGSFVINARGKLLKLGINEASLTVGKIYKLVPDLSETTIELLHGIVADLLEQGIKLSPEAAEGLGKLARELGEDDLPKLMKKLGTTSSLTDKVLASYKLFDADMLAGSKKIANAIGAENLGELMLKYANDPNAVSNANSAAKRIFGKLGKVADPEAIKIAASKGPEAVNALSYWDEALLGTNKKEVAKALANRAGKDAETIAMLEKWVAEGGSLDITKMAQNSTFGNSNKFVIGKWPDEYSALGFDSGYVKYARDINANYYASHPQVFEMINSKYAGDIAQCDELLWSINQKALQGPVNAGKKFEYSLHAFTEQADIDKDLDAIRAIENAVHTGGDWEAATAKYFSGNVPARMREVHELLAKGYIFDASEYLSTKVITFVW